MDRLEFNKIMAPVIQFASELAQSAKSNFSVLEQKILTIFAKLDWAVRDENKFNTLEKNIKELVVKVKEHPQTLTEIDTSNLRKGLQKMRYACNLLGKNPDLMRLQKDLNEVDDAINNAKIKRHEDYAKAQKADRQAKDQGANAAKSVTTVPQSVAKQKPALPAKNAGQSATTEPQKVTKQTVEYEAPITRTRKEETHKEINAEDLAKAARQAKAQAKMEVSPDAQHAAEMDRRTRMNMQKQEEFFSSMGVAGEAVERGETRAEQRARGLPDFKAAKRSEDKTAVGPQPRDIPPKSYAQVAADAKPTYAQMAAKDVATEAQDKVTAKRPSGPTKKAAPPRPDKHVETGKVQKDADGFTVVQSKKERKEMRSVSAPVEEPAETVTPAPPRAVSEPKKPAKDEWKIADGKGGAKQGEVPVQREVQPERKGTPLQSASPKVDEKEKAARRERAEQFKAQKGTAPKFRHEAEAYKPASRIVDVERANEVKDIDLQTVELKLALKFLIEFAKKNCNLEGTLTQTSSKFAHIPLLGTIAKSYSSGAELDRLINKDITKMSVEDARDHADAIFILVESGLVQQGLATLRDKNDASKGVAIKDKNSELYKVYNDAVATYNNLGEAG